LASRFTSTRAALGLARERTEEGARESSGFEALTKMSSQDAKNKETESKIMGAAEAVTALIDAVTKESADGVRAAAERFKKDTKSDIKSLGDANGRTPLHLVRALSTSSRVTRRGHASGAHHAPRASSATAAAFLFLARAFLFQVSFSAKKKPSPRLFDVKDELIIDDSRRRARERRLGVAPCRSVH
jgi:hypothetical protein